MGFDTLFVARAHFKSQGLLTGLTSSPSLGSQSVTDNLQPSNSIGVSATLHARIVTNLARTLERFSLGKSLVDSALAGARNILGTLQSARELALGIDVGPAFDSTAVIEDSILADSADDTVTTTYTAVSETGTAIGSFPVSLLGSVSLQDDALATGSGSITLSTLSETGSVSFLDDAIASVTGNENVASINSFVLQTSINEGDTLTIDLGQGANEIEFGILGNRVSSATELEQEINAISGVSASYTAEGYLQITADDPLTEVTLGGTADLQGVFGISPQTYAPTNLLTQGITQGETLTFQVGADAAQVISFGSGDGEIATLAELSTELANLQGLSATIDGSNRLYVTGIDTTNTVTVAGTVDAAATFGLTQTVFDPTNLLNQGIGEGETLTFQLSGPAIQTITFGTGIGEIETVAELTTELNNLAGINATLTNNTISFSADDSVSSITVGGTADVATVLGIAKNTYDPVNLLTQGLAEGQTLTFQINADAVQKVTFGTDSGEVATLAELAIKLTEVSGVSVAIDGSNRLQVNGSTDDETLTIGGSADVESVFGVVKKAYEPTNLFTLGIESGETLTFQVNDGTIETITFGTGAEEVSTREELKAALEALDGIAATVNASNQLTFTTLNDADSVTVGGTADADGAFGIVKQTYEPTATTSDSDVVSVTTDERDTAVADLERFNASLVLIEQHVLDARPSDGANLIEGLTHLVSSSSRAADQISLGGHDLTLSSLELAESDGAYFVSDASKTTLVAKLDTAISKTETAIFNLEANQSLLAARIGSIKGRITIHNDAANDVEIRSLDLEGARQAAREARQQLGAVAVARGLSGAATDVVKGKDPILNRLVQSAFASPASALFKPIEFSAALHGSSTLAVV